MNTELTTKQARVLEIIRTRWQATGLAPTVREIGQEMGISSSCSVMRHIEALERKGYVRRDRYKYRSVRPVELGAAALTYSELMEQNRLLRRENEALHAELRGKGVAA